MSTRGLLGTALTLWLACSSASMAQAEPPIVTTIKTAIAAYYDGCVAHIGRSDEIKTFVRDRGFKPAHPELRAKLLGSEAGSAWVLPETQVGVAITMRHDGGGCRVLLHNAREELFRTIFIRNHTRLFENSPGAEVEVSKLTDDVTHREGQVIRTLAYRLSHRSSQPSDSDWILSLITNASPSAQVAVTMATAGVPAKRR